MLYFKLCNEFFINTSFFIMLNPYKIGPYSQNYEFRRKGQVLRKRHPHPNSWHFPTKSSELNKLLL